MLGSELVEEFGFPAASPSRLLASGLSGSAAVANAAVYFCAGDAKARSSAPGESPWAAHAEETSQEFIYRQRHQLALVSAAVRVAEGNLVLI